jgi:hypothetical protein
VPLRQKQFAKLFAEARDILDIPGVRLAQAIDQHPTTISRYRSPDYKSGHRMRVSHRRMRVSHRRKRLRSEPRW